MDKKRLEKIRKKYPRAYERWTEEEENLLVQKHNEGLDNKKIASLLQRKIGAIQSRLKFLIGWEYPSGDLQKAYFMRVLFKFDWLPVLYFFPSPVSGFMNQKYGGATVYRWNIYQEFPSDMKILYVGETTRLCPNRLNGYLEPGPTQTTNQRLHSEFNKFKAEGKKIHLEVLQFDMLNINGMKITPEKLKDKSFRLMIEAMLATYYSEKGYELLNL